MCVGRVLLCFINPRVRKIKNEASSCPGIFSRTLRFYYVASSSSSPLPHLLDGHRKLGGSSAIPARSCPGPVRFHWGSIIELEGPADGTPGLMTLHPHNTNVLQSITYAKSPYPPDRSNPGQKKLMLSTRVWPVFPDSITSQWGSPIDTLSLLQSLGAPTELGRSRRVCFPPSLGATAEFGRSRQRRPWNPLYRFEFRRSRRVWALPLSLGAPARSKRNLLSQVVMTCIYMHICVCCFVSISRHSWLYAQLGAGTLGLDCSDTGSGIVEAGCCDTSQHR